MIIDSSANIVRADLARLLVTYKVEPEDRIGITCDVIEYLALRMRERSDVDVFNLAVFVQRDLDRFMYDHGNYPDTIASLANVAFAIKLGRAEFYQAISATPVCFGKRVRSGSGVRRDP